MLSSENVHIGLLRKRLLNLGYIDIPSIGSSMFPFITTGNVCRFTAVRPGSIQVGDVVLFSSSPSHLVGHRVHDINQRIDGEHCFLIKGDTNYFPDGWVHQSDILGRLLYVQKPWMKVQGRGWLSRVWASAVLGFPSTTRILRFYLKIISKSQRLLAKTVTRGHKQTN